MTSRMHIDIETEKIEIIKFMGAIRPAQIFSCFGKDSRGRHCKPINKISNAFSTSCLP